MRSVLSSGWVAAALAGLLLLALPAAAGKIQRFTDPEGTLHITDQDGGEQTKTGAGGMTVTNRPGSFPVPMVQSPVVQPPPVQAPPAETPVVQAPAGQTPAVQPPPPLPPEPEEPPEEGEGPEESPPDEGGA